MWRIYRLPGSRENWHIDAGPDTAVINVGGYQCNAPSHSVDIGGNHVPRAWIEIDGDVELHLVGGVAVFGGTANLNEMREAILNEVRASVKSEIAKS